MTSFCMSLPDLQAPSPSHSTGPLCVGSALPCPITADDSGQAASGLERIEGHLTLAKAPVLHLVLDELPCQHEM